MSSLEVIATTTTSSIEGQIAELTKAFKPQRSPSEDKDQTHDDAEDRAAILNQDQPHQASDTAGIINVSVKKLEDVPHLAADRTAKK